MIQTVMFPSETYTRKAQRILTSRGYTSEMIRITNREGCHFALRIVGKPEEIRAILAEHRIPVSDFRNERDGV